MRQYPRSHHLDDAEDLDRFHAGPAEPEDQVVRFEAADPLLELLDDLLWRAEDEAVARQILERHPEAFFARQHLVLAPLGIGVVFACEERLRRRDRLLMGRRDMRLQ